MSTGSKAFTLRMSPPLSISMPRAFCAFTIRSVSSKSNGMKRIANMTKRAISSTGTLRYFSGRRNHSNAQTMSRGEVVKVISVDNQMAQVSCNPTIRPCCIPCCVAYGTYGSGSPGVMKRCRIAVKTNSQRKGRMPCPNRFMAMDDPMVMRQQLSIKRHNPAHDRTWKTNPIPSPMRQSLTRGSSWWTNDTRGIY